MAKTVQNLIRKTTTKPQKNSKKHRFLTNTKNIEKYTGSGRGEADPKTLKNTCLGV